MPEWTAEITVGGALARRLIGGQFPEIDLRSLERFAEGWDNTLWLVDGRLLFRFPRRAVAVPGLEREAAVLPLLAPLLPVGIPRPGFVGRPGAGYPWPFIGAALLPGREASEAGLDDAARCALAEPLGNFLRVLHSPGVTQAVAAAGPLPGDPMGRADMATRVPRTRTALASAERLGLWTAPASVSSLLDVAEGLPPCEPDAVVHGDLHFRHLLVEEGGALSGVVDWGDVCRGCRSMDLQLAWSFLPAPGRRAFFDAYGPVGEEDLLRARVLALFLGGILTTYGNEAGMTNVAREAVGGLERAAAG